MFYTLLSIIAEVAGFLCMAYSVLFYEKVYWPLFAVGVVFLVIDKYLIPDKKHPRLLDNDELLDIANVIEGQSIEFTMPVYEDTPMKGLVKKGFRGDLVLFFDVDGVLHPNQTETMELKDKLLVLIEAFPDLELIMCSNWRESSPQDWFEKRFGEQLSKHFKGCTPILDSGEFRRQREVEAFVEKFRVKHYVVVDDREDFYHPDYSHLVSTDISVGLTDDTIQELTRALS